MPTSKLNITPWAVVVAQWLSGLFPHQRSAVQTPSTANISLKLFSIENVCVNGHSSEETERIWTIKRNKRLESFDRHTLLLSKFYLRATPVGLELTAFENIAQSSAAHSIRDKPYERDTKS